MKVLQVLPDLNSGGVERGTVEVAEALVAAGHESWVMSAGGKLVAELEASGSQHTTWFIGKKSLLTFLQVRRVRHWLEAQQFDVVHVRSRMPAWILYLAWKKMPVSTRPRLVSSVHGLYSVSRYSAIMCAGELVEVVSKTARDYVLNNYPRVNADKLRLIYRGIDPDVYHTERQPSQEWLQLWQQEFPQLQSAFVVCLPGRITRLKGHLDFLQVIAQLRAAGVPAHGLIVGGQDPKRQSYYQEVVGAIGEQQLTSHITMTGARSDLPNIYTRVNAAVSLSLKPESFGRTVLEALSVGTPVVGYAHGGVAEVLAELYPEGAVEKGNVADAVMALQRIYRQEHQSVAVNRQFLLSSMRQQTLQLYTQLGNGSVATAD